MLLLRLCCAVLCCAARCCCVRVWDVCCVLCFVFDVLFADVFSLPCACYAPCHTAQTYEPDVFESALRVVFSMCQVDVYRRFQLSPAFTRMLDEPHKDEALSLRAGHRRRHSFELVPMEEKMGLVCYVLVMSCHVVRRAPALCRALRLPCPALPCPALPCPALGPVPVPDVCCAVLCCAVLCCAVLCCAVLCCAVLRCAVLR